jgi:hypothetical protein
MLDKINAISISHASAFIVKSIKKHKFGVSILAENHLPFYWLAGGPLQFLSRLLMDGVTGFAWVRRASYVKTFKF